MVAAKLLIDVVVGLAPDMLTPERCRQWCYTSDDYAADKAQADSGQKSRYQTMVEEAAEYAASQMNPAVNNFVRLDWIWL